MWHFLKRQKLQRKGFSCGKKRREQHRSAWAEAMSSSPFVRGLILAAFLSVVGGMVRYLPPGNLFQSMGPVTASACLAAVILVAMVHLRVHLNVSYECNGRFLLVFVVILLQLGLMQAVDFVVRLNSQPVDFLLFCAPFALAPLLLTLLLGPAHGVFAVIYVSLLATLLTDSSVGLHYTLVSLASGMAAVRAARNLRKRGALMRAGIYSALAGIVVCALLGHIEPIWLNPASALGWKRLGTEAPVMLLTGMLTATIAGSLLPLMEAIFRTPTTVSWLELGDLNHPLLRRMTLEAPGTYHHSLMVANLAETAADAIGANPTVCRVCALYHDIGKLNKPEYYIENSHGDENPHDDLTPSMSALVVMAHVKDGVDLALKHKLNHQIIGVIQQHHGNSLIYYFYRRALDQQEEIKKLVAEGKAQPEDIPEVLESSYRYTGPRPDTNESAIISLADAVESAGRSLSKPTPAKIEALIDDIIRSRIRDGQLDDCDLTMSDLKGIRDSFAKTLRTALHRRIPYPEEKDVRDKESRPKDETKILRRETAERERRPKPASAIPAATAAIPGPAAVMPQQANG